MIKVFRFWDRNLAAFTKAFEDYANQHTVSRALQTRLSKLIAYMQGVYRGADLQRLLGRLRDAGGLMPLSTGEAWADVVVADILDMTVEEQQQWVGLAKVCRKAKGAQPNEKWLAEAAPYVEVIGEAMLRKMMQKWMPHFNKPRTESKEANSKWEPDPNWLINAGNGDILRGLIWLCFPAGDDDVSLPDGFALSLRTLGIAAYKKIPKYGARCERVGNSCIWALRQIPEVGVQHLAIMKSKVKLAKVQKLIATGMREAAEQQGISLDELEELLVPTFGFEQVGRYREQMGDFSAEIVVNENGRSVLKWYKADGSPQKTVPTVVKNDLKMS